MLEFRHYFAQLNKNYFIVGDFNAHHQAWEPSKNTPSNYTGRTLHNLINDNIGICLATPPDLPTHIHNRPNVMSKPLLAISKHNDNGRSR